MKLKFLIELIWYFSDLIESDFDIELLKRLFGEDYVFEYIVLIREEVLEKKVNDIFLYEEDFMCKMLVKSMLEEIKNFDFKMLGMKRYFGFKVSKKL